MSSNAVSSDQNGQKKQKSGKKKGLKFPFPKFKKPKESADPNELSAAASPTESHPTPSSSRSAPTGAPSKDSFEQGRHGSTPPPFEEFDEQDEANLPSRKGRRDRATSHTSNDKQIRRLASAEGHEALRRVTVEFGESSWAGSPCATPDEPLVLSTRGHVHELGSDEDEEYATAVHALRERHPTPMANAQKRRSIEVSSAAASSGHPTHQHQHHHHHHHHHHGGRSHAASSSSAHAATSSTSPRQQQTSPLGSPAGSCSPLAASPSSPHLSPVSPRYTSATTAHSPTSTGSLGGSSGKGSSAASPPKDGLVSSSPPPVGAGMDLLTPVPPSASYVVHSDQSHGKIAKFFGDTHAIQDFDKVEYAPQPRHVREMKLRQKFGDIVPFSHAAPTSSVSAEDLSTGGSRSGLSLSNGAVHRDEHGVSTASTSTLGRSTSSSRIPYEGVHEDTEEDGEDSDDVFVTTTRSREAKTTTKIQRFFGQHFNLTVESTGPSGAPTTVLTPDGSCRGPQSPGRLSVPISGTAEEIPEQSGPSAQPLTVDVAKLYKFFGQRVDIVKTADKSSRSNSTSATPSAAGVGGSSAATPPAVDPEMPREPTLLFPSSDARQQPASTGTTPTQIQVRKSTSFGKSTSFSKSSSMSKSASFSKSNSSKSFRDDHGIVTALEISRGSSSEKELRITTTTTTTTTGHGEGSTGGRRRSSDTDEAPSSGELSGYGNGSPVASPHLRRSSSASKEFPLTIHPPSSKFRVVNGPTPPPEKRRLSSKRLSQGSRSTSTGSVTIPKAASSPSIPTIQIPVARVRRRSSQKSAGDAGEGAPTSPARGSHSARAATSSARGPSSPGGSASSFNDSLAKAMASIGVALANLVVLEAPEDLEEHDEDSFIASLSSPSLRNRNHEHHEHQEHQEHHHHQQQPLEHQSSSEMKISDSTEMEDGRDGDDDRESSDEDVDGVEGDILSDTPVGALPRIPIFSDIASGTDPDPTAEPKPKTISVTAPHYRKASSFRVRLDRRESSSPPRDNGEISPNANANNHPSASSSATNQSHRAIRKKSPFRQRGLPYDTAPSKMMAAQLKQESVLDEDTEEERREKIREAQQAKKLRRMFGENVSVGDHNKPTGLMQIAPQAGTVNWKKLNRHFGVGVVDSSSSAHGGMPPTLTTQISARLIHVPLMDDIPEVQSSETDPSLGASREQQHIATDESGDEYSDAVTSDEEIPAKSSKETSKGAAKTNDASVTSSPPDLDRSDSKSDLDLSVSDVSG